MTAQTAADAYLGIDLGTSSVKVVLVGGQGEEVAHADAAYAVHHPSPGWAESAPADWWNADGDAQSGRRWPQRHSVRPVSIGLSGQMHGVVPTRADGTPARSAILWADSRAEERA